METIGNDIILTCRAGGRPKPTITWMDYEGNEIVNGKKFWVNCISN
jgi:immunoglobulin I-set domain protein